jgi:hypothetical protein
MSIRTCCQAGSPQTAQTPRGTSTARFTAFSTDRSLAIPDRSLHTCLAHGALPDSLSLYLWPDIASRFQGETRQRQPSPAPRPRCPITLNHSLPLCAEIACLRALIRRTRCFSETERPAMPQQRWLVMNLKAVAEGCVLGHDCLVTNGAGMRPTYAAGACFPLDRRVRAERWADFERVGFPLAAASLALGRPRLTGLAPLVSSATCWLHKSLTRRRLPAWIVTLWVAGSPHTSHTRTVFSAIHLSFPSETAGVAHYACFDLATCAEASLTRKATPRLPAASLAPPIGCSGQANGRKHPRYRIPDGDHASAGDRRGGHSQKGQPPGKTTEKLGLDDSRGAVSDRPCKAGRSPAGPISTWSVGAWGHEVPDAHPRRAGGGCLARPPN